MTTQVLAPPAVRISVSAAWLSIAALVTYQVLLFALIVARPDLDPSWHTLSEWAIGPHGWVTSGAFLISAAGYAALYRLLRSQLHNRLGRIGRGILLICAAGTVGVGIFTTDPLDASAPSTIGLLHVIFGSSALILLPFAALFINLGLAKNRAWLSARPTLLWSAGLPLLGFLGFALYTAIWVAPLGPHAYGPGVNIGWPPRVAFFTYMLWLVILASQAIRLTSNSQLGARTGDSKWQRPNWFSSPWTSTSLRNLKSREPSCVACEGRSGGATTSHGNYLL